MYYVNVAFTNLLRHLAGSEVAMLSGNVAAIISGGVITVVVSYFTNRYYDVSMGYEIWENTRDIDNPLTPWMEKYQK